jgi:hypothetical protein
MSLDSYKQEANSNDTSTERLQELAGMNDELARLVAANPLADSILLQELVLKAKANKDMEMQRAIARNPNTPTQWLLGFAYLFPEEFFSNPAYHLSILANVNFTYSSSRKLLLGLVSATNAPESFLEFAADICERNIQLLRKDKYFSYRRNRLYDMLRDFDRGRYHNYEQIFIQVSNLEYYGVILASHPHTSAEIISKLAKHPTHKVRVLVASHHNITQNTLNLLICDRNLEVITAALANPKLDPLFKQQLAKLENPNLLAVDLSELANSNYTTIRVKVAQNHHVDASILSKLVNDKLIVRLAVAKHPKTSTEILTKFTTHPDRRLHLAVAQNPGASLDLLAKLATQPAVKGGFHCNPLNLAAMKSLLTQNPEAAIPFLEQCLKYPDQPSFSRFLVLMNPHIPSSFLAKHYKSWYWAERYAIAQNFSSDRNILQQLTQDSNCIVRATACETLNLTTAFMH